MDKTPSLNLLINSSDNKPTLKGGCGLCFISGLPSISLIVLKDFFINQGQLLRLSYHFSSHRLVCSFPTLPLPTFSPSISKSLLLLIALITASLCHLAIIEANFTSIKFSSAFSNTLTSTSYFSKKFKKVFRLPPTP